MMRASRGRGRGGGRRPRPPRGTVPDDAEEGEVRSLSPPLPSPSFTAAASSSVPLSSYAAMAAAPARGGGRGRGSITRGSGGSSARKGRGGGRAGSISSNTSHDHSAPFRGGGGGGNRHRMPRVDGGGRGGGRRFGNDAGAAAGTTHSGSRFHHDDGGSVASTEESRPYARPSGGRGGRGRGRGGRGSSGVGGRAYMMHPGRAPPGRGSSSYAARGNSDWNYSHDAGSVSSYEAIAGGGGTGRSRGRGGRSHGRGRGRGGRFDAPSSSGPPSSFTLGKRRRDDDRAIPENTEIIARDIRETAPSFGSEGEILPGQADAPESQWRSSHSNSPDRPSPSSDYGNSRQDRSASYDGAAGRDNPLADNRTMELSQSINEERPVFRRDSLPSDSSPPPPSLPGNKDDCYRAPAGSYGPAGPERQYTTNNYQSYDEYDERPNHLLSERNGRGWSQDSHHQYMGGSPFRGQGTSHAMSRPGDQEFEGGSSDHGMQKPMRATTENAASLSTPSGRSDSYDDRQQLVSRSEFGAPPKTNEFHLNERRHHRRPEAVATGENKVLQSGYAALANLPGPIRPQKKPPPSSIQSTAAASASAYGPSSSYSSAGPPRMGGAYSQSERGELFRQSRGEPFSDAHSGTVPRLEHYDRQDGFDGGRRSQNWGGSGRGRGRHPARGGRGGPRPFEPMIQGRGRGGRGDRAGDMARIHGRGERGDGSNGRASHALDGVPAPSGRLSPYSSMESYAPSNFGPVESVPVDNSEIRLGERPQDGGFRSSSEAFRGGRGRGALGRLAGRGRQRDYGVGRESWDQGVTAPQSWDHPSVPQSSWSAPDSSQNLPPPPASTTLTRTFAMLADSNPSDLLRRRPLGETSDVKPPPSQSLPSRRHPSYQGAAEQAEKVDPPTENEDKSKSPSPPPRPASPPPGEPSGLVVALTRLANMEEQLNFAYTRHLKLVAEQKKMRASYEKLQDLPVGLEAIENELRAHVEARAAPEESVDA